MSKWRSGRCGALFVEIHRYGRGEGEAERLIKDKVVEWQHMKDRERVTEVLDYACRNGGVGRSVKRIWWKRYVTNCTPPHADPNLVSLSVSHLIHIRLNFISFFQCCMGCAHPSVLLHMVPQK